MGAITDRVPGALPNQELEQILGAWFCLRKEQVSIQPASFDPPISDKCYRLAGKQGIKIPEGVNVEEYLRRMPRDSWKTCDLSKQHVVAPNSVYLIALEASVDFPDRFLMRSSPKSTQGRLGTFVRMIGDGCPNMDEIEGPFKGTLWAVYETHAFHLGMQAGDKLNQLRLFCQHPFKMDGEELRQQFYDLQLLYINDKHISIDDIQLHEGLPLTLDLQGRDYDGIVGFKAKNNPEPISLRAKGTANPLDYFEVITAPRDGQIIIEPNEFYIFFTRERVRIPGHLAMEMSPYYRRAGAARLHKAGFFDPFFGYGRAGEIKGSSAVLEVDSHERQAFPLVHGQSAGVLEVQRLRKTATIVYGEAENSYQGQEGPRLAKQFTSLDFRELAETIDKFKVPVMVVPRSLLFTDSTFFQGFRTREGTDFYEHILENSEFRIRGEVEENPSFKQPIPYLAFYCPATKRVFAYRRTSDEKIAPERRLHGKWSIGIGGHVRHRDNNTGKPLEACLQREVFDEEVAADMHQDPVLLGYINNETIPVDTVHFGLLYACAVEREDCVRLREPALKESRWMTIEELRSRENKEYWTTIALDPLEKLVR